MNMAHLYRARMVFIIAVVFAIGAIAVEFPLSELLRQRSELAGLATQLQAVDSHNAVLRSDIASLSQPSTIASIAHQDYGLVRPGQRSYVILPGPGSSAIADPLAMGAIPAADLVAAPTSASVVTPPAPAPAPAPLKGSFWTRVANRLEFWR
jgi:cell division protein FtsB